MLAPDRYQLLGPIASGGMAEVLLARTRGPGGFERLLAVKRIKPELSRDPEQVRMFLDEARNAARLVHHNIVQVIDVDLRDGAVFYAMEYLHGQTLDSVIARARVLPRDAAVAIGIAIAAGLHHAHERPSSIVHRDVAPSNVMVTYDGNVKLIDFGIAKATENLSRTAFGMFKGRLGYSSPEQCRCEPVDRRTDIYSLGVVLYELTTGRRTFTADSDPELLDHMAQARVTPPRALDASYPPQLETIVMRALAAAPGDRYPTADALQRDLEDLARISALNLSAVSLSRLMGELFAEELAPWRAAQKTGITLEEHITRHTLIDVPPTFDTWALERVATAARETALERKTTVARPPARGTRPPSREPRVWLGVVAMICLFGLGYLIARWWIS
ncbi:MAG TPA: serine/threonine-protein kinase [Kofleriaceae bacterium]|nr:serine/threonine-protein kinase [Kofleriaceae bacterium]